MSSIPRTVSIELKWEHNELNTEIVNNLIRPLKTDKKLTEFATLLLINFAGSSNHKFEKYKFEALSHLDNAIEFQKNVMGLINKIVISEDELQIMRYVQKLQSLMYKINIRKTENPYEILESSLIKISWNQGDPDYKDYDLVLPDLHKNRELTSTLKSLCLDFYCNIHMYPGYISDTIHKDIVTKRRNVLLFNNFVREFEIIKSNIADRTNHVISKAAWEDLIFYIKQQGVRLEEFLIYSPDAYEEETYGFEKPVSMEQLEVASSEQMETLISSLRDKIDDQQAILEILVDTIKNLNTKLDNLVVPVETRLETAVVKETLEEPLKTSENASIEGVITKVEEPKEDSEEEDDDFEIDPSLFNLVNSITNK